MITQVADLNETSIELARCLWGVTPTDRDWHIAVGYTGKEESPEDIQAAIGFVLSEGDMQLTSFRFPQGALLSVMQVLLCACDYAIQAGATNVKTLSRESTFLDSIFSVLQIEPYALTGELRLTSREHLSLVSCGHQQVHPIDDIRQLSIYQDAMAAASSTKYFNYDNAVDVIIDDDTTTAGYFSDDKLVGFVSFDRYTTLFGGGYGRIKMLYVSPAHRRRGIGTALMDIAKACLGSGSIIVSSHYFSNMPVDFWQRCGVSGITKFFSAPVEQMGHRCRQILDYWRGAYPSNLAGRQE